MTLESDKNPSKLSLHQGLFHDVLLCNHCASSRMFLLLVPLVTVIFMEMFLSLKLVLPCSIMHFTPAFSFCFFGRLCICGLSVVHHTLTLLGQWSL
jgi:hypothetical protein